ncbi:MAG: glutaredoxin family protein [Acidobacteriota bacterium]
MKNTNPPAKAIVTIYTRPGCHLCEDAKANILASGYASCFTIEEINIDEDETLKQQFQYDIPVIRINGIKVFKHFVDPKAFARKFKRIAGI